MNNSKSKSTFIWMLGIMLLIHFASQLGQMSNDSSIEEKAKEKKVAAQTVEIKNKTVRSGDVIVEFGGAGEVRFGGFVSDERYALVVSNGIEDHYYSASSETYYFHVNEKEIKIPRTKLHMQVKSHDNQKNTIHAVVKK